MKETEITVKLFNELDAAKQILQEKGFSLKRKCIMTDIYFSKFSIQELKSFSYEDLIRNSFLVRNFSGDGNVNQMIFKDKVLDKDGNVIAEEKIACNVDDLQKAKQIFNLAGLNSWCELKQEMFIYKKGILEFAIQVVDGLGIFVEYEEDESVKGLPESEKIRKMLQTLGDIGLKIGKDFSCKKVWLKFKKENPN